MPDILMTPDISIDDNVGITIEYLNITDVLGTKPRLAPKELPPPLWADLWSMLKWRLQTDLNNLREWVKQKWQSIRQR